MPKISVIIPSYNHAPFIADAIQSVLNQTFQDFEILIIDDGSKDNSVEVIKTFTDSRIHFLVNEENKGAVYTTNKMIEHASGEYIALLNSDDVWETNKLEKQISFLENNQKYGVVFSNAQIINQDGSVFESQEHFYATVFEQPNCSRFEWLNYFFNVGNAICHPSMLIRRSVYEDVGLYNPLMASLPDFEMWVRICLKYEIFIMPDKLVKFRILDNEQNASGANPENIIACQFEYKHILDHFLNLSETEYEKVFNESVINTVNFSLAQKSLEKPNEFFRVWGLDILYTELEKNPMLLTPKEYTALTRKNDIFNIINKVDYSIQLFIDEGNGIIEKNSIKFPVSKNAELQEFIFDISNYENITNLRLDPLNDSCVIEIEKLSLTKHDGTELSLVSNVVADVCSHHGKSYFFDANDPQIYFGDIGADALLGPISLVAKIRFAYVGKDALHVSLKQTKIELNDIKGSLSWRFTRPFRTIKKILRKYSNELFVSSKN